MSTPSLFPEEPADLAALAEIAARSITRAELSRTAMNLVKSTDLFDVGYSVSHWLTLPSHQAETGRTEVLEFNPRHLPGRPCPLPRVTATTYEEQRAIHEAIGARVLPPGRTFSSTKEPGR